MPIKELGNILMALSKILPVFRKPLKWDGRFYRDKAGDIFCPKCYDSSGRKARLRRHEGDYCPYLVPPKTDPYLECNACEKVYRLDN